MILRFEVHLVFAVLFCLCPTTSFAQVIGPYCEGWDDHVGDSSVDFPAVNPRGENKFKVNIESFDAISNIGRKEGLKAILRSTEQWNSHGTAGWFTYEGTTTATSNENCYDTTPENLVIVDSSCGGSLLGQVTVFCGDPIWQYGGLSFPRWRLRVCADNATWNVGTGIPGSSVRDLNGLLTHELGHAIGLWHPEDDNSSCVTNNDCVSGACTSGQCGPRFNANGTSSVMMNSGALSSSSMKRRQLYPTDVECLDQIVGRRNTKLSAFNYTGPISSNYDNSSVLAKNNIVRGGGVGFGQNGGDFATVSYDRYHRMGPGYYNVSTSTSYLNSKIVGVGPSATWWGDSRLRFMFNTDTSPDRFVDWWASFDVFQFNYDLQLTPGNINKGYMNYCTNSSCSGTKRMKSGFGVSWAQEDYTDKMVVAWAQQDRTFAGNNRVMVGVKQSTFKVNLPKATDILTETGVQVACGQKYRTMGSNDCILVYTRQYDPLYKLRVLPFWVDGTDIRLGTEIELPGSNYSSVAETAVWYAYDRYWMAYKNDFGFVALVSSANGSSWSFDRWLGTSITAPRAAFLNDVAHNTDDFVVYRTGK